MNRLVLIVEGHGELRAGPLLVRRILEEHGEYGWTIDVQRRHDLAHLRGRGWGNFERYLKTAYGSGAPILWMLDCDDACVKDILGEFVTKANDIGIRQPLAFAFWEKEFEVIFLYEAALLGRRFGLSGTLELPERPASVRGAKEWISALLPKGRSYKETIDQEKLTAGVGLSLLRDRDPSFQHLEKALLWLVQAKKPELYPYAKWPAESR
jgi:hypothetical protein